MSDRPDCIHHLDLCPTCDGLRVTRLERIEGVTSISVDAEGAYLFDGALALGGVTDLYMGPVAEDCAKKVEETP